MKINWSLDWIKLQPELSHQKVAPTVTYRDIAIDILIDVVSKNQKVIEIIMKNNFSKYFKNENILKNVPATKPGTRNIL